MSTATINQSFVRTGAGQFFLQPYPVNLAQNVVGISAITLPGATCVTGQPLVFTGGTVLNGNPATGYAVGLAGVLVGVVITNPGTYTLAPTGITVTGSTGTAVPLMGNPAFGPLRDTIPSAAPGFADYIEGFFQEYYTDPKARKVLRSDAQGIPWGNLDANGLSVKIKQNPVEFDANNAPKVPIGIQDTSVTAEITFADVDPNHLADVLSATLNQKVTIAPSVGKAGRMSVSIGGSNILNNYTGMYRMASVLYPGEFDHYLFLRPVIIVDTDLKLSKKDTVTCKIKLTCQPDKWIYNLDSGTPELAVAEIANAAGL